MNTRQTLGLMLVLSIFPGFLITGLAQNDTVSLRNKIEQLEQALAKAKADLAQAETSLRNANDTGPDKITIGDFKIGGAVRVNWAIGTYETGEGPTRGAKGGNFALDTFRVNIDYAHQNLIGKFEYRFMNGYSFLHTGWLGYDFADGNQIQVGVNRVPFGPGPYGISNSWFFDQHYYVGLSDDMDLGIKYTRHLDDVTMDLAYYFSDEGNWLGSSNDSARYGYDPVVWEYDTDGDGVSEVTGYGERNQINFRLIRHFRAIATDVGFSLQYNQLEGRHADDGSMYATSIHLKKDFGKLSVNTQLSYYNHDVGALPTGDDETIVYGAWDFAWPIAAEAMIPAVGISYYIPTTQLDWLDAVTLYAEYSSIIKTGTTASGEDFEDSNLYVIGSSFWRGGWFIYLDVAFSDGNFFVGGDHFNDFGPNTGSKMQSRVNLNLGYYF